MDPAAPEAIVQAAGGVVHRRTERGTELLLVHRPRYDDWSLPKGTLLEGESYPVGALREVEEETGIVGRLGLAVGSVGYEVRRGPKVVRYWLIEASGGRFSPNREVDEVRWLSVADAGDMASYARDANVIQRAARLLTQPKSAAAYLVRHASAGERNDGDGADHDRPLSARGRRQAQELTVNLLRIPITRIESSYYARCEQTVEPLAGALDLPIGHEPSLVEGGAPEHIVEFLHSLHSDSAVLCSHGDVISRLIGHLGAQGVEFESPPSWQKGSMWELDLVRGRVVGGRYVPPPV